MSRGAQHWVVALATAMAGCGGGHGAPSVDSGQTAGIDARAQDGGEPDAGPPPVTLDLVKYVDPFIGTDDSDSPHPVPNGAGGNMYPAAVAPFGMVQIGPDTPTADAGGYRHSDGIIKQFSLTHLDGAGCSNDQDFPFMPVAGAWSASPGTHWSNYRAAYDKSSEAASPGYYHAKLATGIDVEVSATTRAGFARLTYPDTQAANLFIHTGLSATGERNGSVEIVGTDRIRGTALAGGFCGSSETFTVHFVAQFDKPFAAHGTWLGDNVAADSSQATGARSGAYVTFAPGTSTVNMKVAISYVSRANAQKNLDAELPGWDFDAVRAATSDRWNQVLNRIQVTGGSDEALTKFYTSLYRVFSNPNIASDVDGQYMGFDRAVHTATGWTVYQNYSGWDIIRSWTHLMGAIAPETSDIVHSMVEDGVQGGLLPFWTHQNVETNVMVGDPGTVNVANAYAMGVRGFDTSAALALMKESASNPNHTQRYDLSGWINDHHAGNAATTLEYAMADFSIAQFAAATGDSATHDAYMKRSAYWSESWNPTDHFVEPRVAKPGPGINAARIYEVEVFGPAAPSTNLAKGAPATASASCGAAEGPEKANNGTWNGGNSDKWCDNVSNDKWWRVDLGAEKMLSRVVLHHAGAGGESAQWNTQDFAIRVSTDGANWTTVADVKGSTGDTTTHNFAAVSARYLRLDISTAIQLGNIGGWDCQPLQPGSECGFIEGNAAQYLWMVPHNLEGLFTLMGGHAAAKQRLDDLFTEFNAGTNRPFFYIGNEPEHGTPWTYNFLQAPAATSDVVRRIADEAFRTSAGGWPGNDDLGATSAWFVWSSLGMYPMIPGSDVLVVNGPRFPSAVVHLANGKTLTINGNGAPAPYVHALRIDGVETTHSWFRFADISHGATLDYTMAANADATWGTLPEDRPPSYTP